MDGGWELLAGAAGWELLVGMVWLCSLWLRKALFRTGTALARHWRYRTASLPAASWLRNALFRTGTAPALEPAPHWRGLA